jgi:hypothetical protein
MSPQTARFCHAVIVAVILDCIDDAAKSFYQSYDFAELHGRPYRVPQRPQLEAMFNG